MDPLDFEGKHAPDPLHGQEVVHLGPHHQQPNQQIHHQGQCQGCPQHHQIGPDFKTPGPDHGVWVGHLKWPEDASGLLEDQPQDGG